MYDEESEVEEAKGEPLLGLDPGFATACMKL
jgi:hypothetical protein